MENRQVPQDNISTLARHRKALYATNADGLYEIVASSGWRVEEAATRQALEEFERLARKAYALVLAGRASPLYYHMYAQRMDPPTLAQATGLWLWRIRRHFRPQIFAGLGRKRLSLYAQALGLELAELTRLPHREADA
ncbi:MAG TPA: hypothetical protein ENN66_02600 [Proteobacteria bacterium]|nr:hypothetical protein [Pseudomonadota bacterium]